MRATAILLLTLGAACTIGARFVHPHYVWDALFTALIGLALVGVGIGFAALDATRRATRH